MSEWERRDTADPVGRPLAPVSGRLVSTSLPAPGITALDFLRQAAGRERFYWEDGRGQITFAGFGVTADLMAWGANRFRAIAEQARELFADAIVFDERVPLAAPRLFGGFAFRDDFTPDNTWAAFHPAHFVLPHYQLVQVEDQSWLTLNAQLAPEDDPEESLVQLRQALKTRYELLRQQPDLPVAAVGSPAPPATIRYPLPYPSWADQIERAVARMKDGVLEKVVLSRVCEVRFSRRVDVDGALAFLKRQYASCYRFLFEPRPYHAFFGATPELLAQVNGRVLTTMSLASSIGRGPTPAADERLAQQLLADPKERHEHEVVVAALRRRLAPLTKRLAVPDSPQVLRLSNIQHLFTPVEGELHQPSGILPVVESLHPTPALGGTPRALALAFIQDAELVPRGWYAGPVGWMDYKLDGAFGVAIRSAVCQEQRVWLYAGAGIVADSQPQKEWDETALKFQPILQSLGLKT